MSRAAETGTLAGKQGAAMYKNVAGEIIAIGDELTCGRVANTH